MDTTYKGIKKGLISTRLDFDRPIGNQEAFLMSPATYNQYPTIRDGKSQGESLCLPPGILPSLQGNSEIAGLLVTYVQPSPSEGGTP